MKLGVKLDIPASAKLITAPIKRVFCSKHYEHIIGIGKDHTASLIIDEDALKELQKKGGRLGTLVMPKIADIMESLKKIQKKNKEKVFIKIYSDGSGELCVNTNNEDGRISIISFGRLKALNKLLSNFTA